MDTLSVCCEAQLLPELVSDLQHGIDLPSSTVHKTFIPGARYTTISTVMVTAEMVFLTM